MSINTVKITKDKLDEINDLCKSVEIANRISDEVTSTISLHMLENKGKNDANYWRDTNSEFHQYLDKEIKEILTGLFICEPSKLFRALDYDLKDVLSHAAFSGTSLSEIMSDVTGKMTDEQLLAAKLADKKAISCRDQRVKDMERRKNSGRFAGFLEDKE